MKTWSLILKEISHRWVTFLLTLLAVVVAVGLYVFAVTTAEASHRETVRLMRDMGLNLRIIPGKTDMNAFWDRGFPELTMPEEYAQRLAGFRGFSSNHISATLIDRITWRGQAALLVGIAPEIFPPGKEKPPIVAAVEQGTVYVGSQLARSLNVVQGEQVEIMGRTFTVAGCGAETGTSQDISIQCHLRDAQEILGQPGRINEIRAIDCLCNESQPETLSALRFTLAKVLPDTRVIQLDAQARARREQRVMVRGTLFDLVLPAVVVVCAVWIGALAMINVRERRREIGILRALGHGGARVAALFLGRALAAGVAGAILGFAIGTALSLAFGPDVFKVTAGAIEPAWTLLGHALVGAAGLAGLACFVPATIAATQDPANSLKED